MGKHRDIKGFTKKELDELMPVVREHIDFWNKVYEVAKRNKKNT